MKKQPVNNVTLAFEDRGAGQVVVKAVVENPAEGLDHQQEEEKNDSAENRGPDERHPGHYRPRSRVRCAVVTAG